MKKVVLPFVLVFGCQNDECRWHSLDKVVRLEKIYQTAINAAIYKPTGEVIQQTKGAPMVKLSKERKMKLSVEIPTKK